MQRRSRASSRRRRSTHCTPANGTRWPCPVGQSAGVCFQTATGSSSWGEAEPASARGCVAACGWGESTSGSGYRLCPKQWRCHRVPGDGRGRRGSRLRARLHVEPRVCDALSTLAALLRVAGDALPPDPLRQAGHRVVRPRGAVRDARDADGGHARGARRGRVSADRGAGVTRGVRDGGVVCGVVSRTDDGTCPVPPERGGSWPIGIPHW